MSQNKIPVVRNTCVEWRKVITMVLRHAKSTVFKLGYYTHQLVFICTPAVAIGFRTCILEPASKQLEASPPQQSGLQLESVSLNQ